MTRVARGWPCASRGGACSYLPSMVAGAFLVQAGALPARDGVGPAASGVLPARVRRARARRSRPGWRGPDRAGTHACSLWLGRRLRRPCLPGHAAGGNDPAVVRGAARGPPGGVRALHGRVDVPPRRGRSVPESATVRWRRPPGSDDFERISAEGSSEIGSRSITRQGPGPAWSVPPPVLTDVR